jgi:UPF0755 protein
MKKIIFLGFVIFGIYMGSKLYLHWTRPYSDSNTRVSFSIARGVGLKKIATLLEEKELIRDAFTFELYARKHKIADKFQAGDYVIQRNQTYAEVAEMIQTGRSKEIKITFPEGSTIKQMDEILASKNLIEMGDIESCTNTCAFTKINVPNLEGYLFPSTYMVSTDNFSTKLFISRLYNTFQQQIEPFKADILDSGRSLNEIVIVASMIEREAFGDSLDEKKQIADVIWKRLDERIHLGIDATTRYELNEWKRPLYTADFAKATPYNTRKNYGLPPTAISNPGIDSLRAAIYPISTPYYYYLHGLDGQIHFAKDYEGHNVNKYRYLR